MLVNVEWMKQAFSELRPGAGLFLIVLFALLCLGPVAYFIFPLRLRGALSVGSSQQDVHWQSSRHH